MSGSNEIMRPGFLGFPSSAQGFGIAIRKAISEAREFSKSQQVRFYVVGQRTIFGIFSWSRP